MLTDATQQETCSTFLLHLVEKLKPGFPTAAQVVKQWGEDYIFGSKDPDCDQSVMPGAVSGPADPDASTGAHLPRPGEGG